MSRYDPFQNSLSELTADDLACLKNVSEGWYVDYKEKGIKAEAIAKHLCSFANTYGGWIFFGIKEESKDNPVAGSFPGLSKIDTDTLLQRLRNASDQHCSASVFFETRVVKGPSKNIGLSENKSVLIVRITESVLTPHIHSSGRIYRRVNDGSEPYNEIKHINELENLYKRKDNLTETFKKILSRNPSFDDEDIGFPYLSIFAFGSLDGSHEQGKFLNFHEFNEALNDKTTSIMSLTYDQKFSTDGSYFGRHVQDNDPSNPLAYVKFLKSLQTEFFYPLRWQKFELVFSEYFYNENTKSVLNTKLSEALIANNYSKIKVINLAELFRVLMCQMGTLISLMKASDYAGRIMLKVKLNNLRGLTTFIDDDLLVESTNKHGVPVFFNNEIFIPFGQEIDSLLEYETLTDEDYKNSASKIAIDLMMELLLVAGYEVGLRDSGAFSRVLTTLLKTEFESNFVQHLES